jgi:hypothetical protein
VLSLLTRRLSARGGCAVLGLVLLRVLLEDLRVGGVGRDVEQLCKREREYEFFLHRLLVGTASHSGTKTDRAQYYCV